MNTYNFTETAEMDNKSETAFKVMFFKQSGKYLDTVYFTVNAPENADAYETHEVITMFVEEYERYRDATAVVIAGPNSLLLPQLISAERRKETDIHTRSLRFASLDYKVGVTL